MLIQPAPQAPASAGPVSAGAVSAGAVSAGPASAGPAVCQARVCRARVCRGRVWSGRVLTTAQVQLPVPADPLDGEAELLVDRDHVRVGAGVAGLDVPDRWLALLQPLQHGDLQQQAEPVPAVLRQDGSNLLERPVRRVGLDAHLGQRGELAGRVVTSRDRIAGQLVLGHDLLGPANPVRVPDQRLDAGVPRRIGHGAVDPAELIQVLGRSGRQPGHQRIPRCPAFRGRAQSGEPGWQCGVKGQYPVDLGNAAAGAGRGRERGAGRVVARVADQPGPARLPRLSSAVLQQRAAGAGPPGVGCDEDLAEGHGGVFLRRQLQQVAPNRLIRVIGCQPGLARRAVEAGTPFAGE